MNYNFVLVALATFCFFEIVSGQQSDPVESHGIYKIINKEDKGAVTVMSGNNTQHVFLKNFNDSATQKWKAHKPLLYKSFELKPTSNDQANLDVDPATTEVLGKIDASGDAKYWYIKDIGEGAYQVKNLQYSTCLTSQGLNKMVALANCENSAQQQWVFTKL